ncbi:hypothetical protein [Anaeromyxobacter paludicola]|uniref:hypothetical protein n=1 Tax=Anaeromyxobacter paludicola TaxID=2918171 RepID=UPI0020BD898B|nr:hypothetical protein [Anaeromyxobacter paludicola]
MLALALAAGAFAARADILSLYLEPTYSVTSTDTTDQAGRTTHLDSRSLLQNYRLTLDERLSPALSLTAGGLFRDQRTWSDGPTGSSLDDDRARGVYGRLTLTLPYLTSGLSYDLRDEATYGSPRVVNETWSGVVGWRPLELPQVTLQVTRGHVYDVERARIDTTTTAALLSALYTPAPWDFKYVLSWNRPDDAIGGTVSNSIDQTAQATYSERLLEDRTTVYASLTLHNQNVSTSYVGTGTITQQQRPLSGLSLVDVFPAEPGTDTLSPNPALVDGSLTTGASLDIGYGPSLAGDRNLREMGVQFADAVTPVNTVRVWVDRKVRAEVVGSYTWSVYRSDDNLKWTAVPITGPVTFDSFENRFELPIQSTQARYLKAVTAPLVAGSTLDTTLASVLVTEVQTFLVLPASAVPRERTTSSAALNASATTLLWRRANLTHDVTVFLARQVSPDVTTYGVSNGLGASQRLSATLQATERVVRLDSDAGTGHTGQTQWNAGLIWTPLPTLTSSLIYSGQYVESAGALTDTISAFARADLWEGLSAQANAAGSVVNDATKDTWTGTFNLTASAVPNRFVSFTLGWLSSVSRVYSSESEEPIDSESARVDASVAFHPTDALSGSATVSRTLVVPSGSPSTLATVQLNYSPFRGDLQLSAGYARTLDTASDTTTEIFTPALRWIIRRNVTSTASYTILHTTSPVQETRSRTLSVGLSILW